jgi:hypothetical protein
MVITHATAPTTGPEIQAELLELLLPGKEVRFEVSEDVEGEGIAIAVLVLELLGLLEETIELVVTSARVEEGCEEAKLDVVLETPFDVEVVVDRGELLTAAALAIRGTRELWPYPYNNYPNFLPAPPGGVV